MTENRTTQLLVAALIAGAGLATIDADNALAQSHVEHAESTEDHAEAHAAAAAGHEADAAHADPHAAAEHGVAAARPGIAENASTVGAGVFHLEGGYSLTRLEGENSHAVGEAVLRYGVSDRVEARVVLGSYARAWDHGHAVSGFEDVAAAVKAELQQGHGWQPSVAVIAGAAIPTGSDPISHGEWMPQAALTSEWTLPGHFSVTLFEGVTGPANDFRADGELTGALEVGFPLVQGLHGHAEYAAIAPFEHLDERLNHFSGGVGIPVGNDLVADVWGGYASHHGEGEVLFGVGFARRW